MSQQHNGQKHTKFGFMMNSMGNSALKSMSRAGKQMGKAAVKAKQTAVTKIGKIPPTPEDPEIEVAEATLKVIKNDIYSISDIVSNLYESRVHETTYLSQLSDRLKQIQSKPNDTFSIFANKMGIASNNLERIHTEHLKKMEDELVKPFEKFRDTEIEYAQKLKLKCRNNKTQFDISNHNLNKAKQSNDQMKIQNCKQKYDSVNKQLMEVRSNMKIQVNRLVQTQQTSLVNTLQKYWDSYGAYSAAQSNIINNGYNYNNGQNEKKMNENIPPNRNSNMNNNNNVKTNYGNTPPNRNANMNNKNMKTNYGNTNVNRNNTQENYNRAAMKSVAQNTEVQNATKSAMKDKNVRNAAYNAYKTGGNDPNQNRKVVSALAQNKQMQGAAVSVAKDKNVQKAAWNSAQNNAKNAYGKYNNNNNNNNNYGNKGGYNNNYQKQQNQEEYYDDEEDDDDEFADEMDNGP
eukprot:380062_1